MAAGRQTDEPTTLYLYVTYHDDGRLHDGELIPDALAGAAAEGQEAEVGGDLVGVKARHVPRIVAGPALVCGVVMEVEWV